MPSKLVGALREPQKKSLSEDYSFPARRRSYCHQLEAWRALIESHSPHSVLVSSGTGAGKTECFLIPILNDLVAELERRRNAPLIVEQLAGDGRPKSPVNGLLRQ